MLVAFTAAPVTVVAFKAPILVAPITVKLLLNVAAPLTVRLLVNVVGPVIAAVPVKVVVPATLRFEPTTHDEDIVVAPTTVNVSLRFVAPVTVNVPLAVVGPVTVRALVVVVEFTPRLPIT